MMTVVWSEDSKNSLTTIYEYIFSDSPQNAEMVLDALLALGNSLNNSHIEYAKDPILNDDRFRSIPKWNYKIIYERKANEVIILDVFDTRQDPNKLTL